MSLTKKLISVVTPCLNEEDNVRRCYSEVRRIIEQELPGYDYEHVFCDNDSQDATPQILRDLADEDPRVKVILNSRNFGPIHSNYNGILATSGDAVVLCLPADIQDPPEVIPEFVAKWEQGYHVVYGHKARREEGLVMRALRAIHYRLSARCSFVEIPIDVGLFQLVDKAVIEALRKSDDHFPYIQGLVAHAGFKRAMVDYTWRKRDKNKSKATWSGLIDQGLNGLTAFSRAPLRATLYCGLWFMILAASIGLASLMADVLWNGVLDLPAVPSMLLGLWFFSGVQLFSLGLMGEYVSAIHFQVRRRPMVVERGRINFEQLPSAVVPLPRPHFAIHAGELAGRQDVRGY